MNPEKLEKDFNKLIRRIHTEEEAATSSKAEKISERLVEVVPYHKNAYSAHWFLLKQKELNLLYESINILLEYLKY